MLTKATRLVELLSQRSEQTLVDVKFFIGSNRETTAEELQDEAEKAISQMAFGTAQRVDSIDRDIAKTDLSRFVA